MGMLQPILLLLAVAVAAALFLRVTDLLDERAERRRLLATQASAPARFDPAQLAALPEPARRYFGFVIEPGTPLLRVAEIEMDGQFSLGTRDKPGYRPMRARQVLAWPHGFLWSVVLRGGVPIAGSDSLTWTRFRVAGCIPVARQGGTMDHARAAYGRMAAEAVFWTPAALLPGAGVAWEAVDANTARVTLTHGALAQAVDVTVAPDGQPTQVRFLRWSNANPERVFRLQPFGGVLADFRPVQGFRVPFKVVAGNHFGTAAYHEFFRADLRALRFAAAPD